MEIIRRYQHQFNLKYGCNPHQSKADIFSSKTNQLPFKVLNGKLGYINLLDAINAWQLVHELHEVLQLPSAASFKHVSPAGAAVAVPLDNTLENNYGTKQFPTSQLARAYLRARDTDPLSSFGDFIALSHEVDPETASLIRGLVSDGIIAPAYSGKALKILKEKKNGGFIILQADSNAEVADEEYREVYGVVFRQQLNRQPLNETTLLGNVVTRVRTLPENVRRDLVLATIVIKYTQSNSVGYALNGQMIGIGAGQQSRVDCTKLAGRKAETWFLRTHPRVVTLPFHERVNNFERTNACISFIEGDMTSPEKASWLKLFTKNPGQLSLKDKKQWIEKMNGISLSSDAFFPFRDNIDQASRRGVKFIVQPGGSVRDELLIEAANEYGMIMAFSGIRLFHH